MGYFTEDEIDILSRSTVRMATLVDLEFSDAPVYVWNGIGTRIFDGKSYLGLGDLGTIDGLEETRGAVSQQVTFTLSGVPGSPADILSRVLSATDYVQGNYAVVYSQLFTETWAAATSEPIAIYIGQMMPPRVTREAGTSERGARRVLTLPTENIFYGRHRPPNGRYTDREQQKRFPDDLFCEYTPQLVNLTLTWPDY